MRYTSTPRVTMPTRIYSIAEFTAFLLSYRRSQASVKPINARNVIMVTSTIIASSIQTLLSYSILLSTPVSFSSYVKLYQKDERPHLALVTVGAGAYRSSSQAYRSSSSGKVVSEFSSSTCS